VPAFRAVRQKLPGDPLVSLFIEPRFVERVLAATPRPTNERDERTAAMLAHYLHAVRYAGAALDWRDGLVLHTEEQVDPSKLDPTLRHWAARSEPGDPRLARVPPTALAVATARVDLLALFDSFRALSPGPERARLDNLLVAAQGLALGLDLRGEVAPRLGPTVSLYLDRPTGNASPFVVSVQVASTPEGARVASAVDNALRTFLALSTLDASRGTGQARLETRTVGQTAVVALSGGASPFAYAVHDGRVVIGPTADAVLRALEAQADPGAGARFRRVHDRYCPGVESFACVDLKALHAFADSHRPALTRRSAQRQHRSLEEAARDLDQALAFIALFDSAYVTSTVDPAFTSVHRTLGLVARAADGP
jgi:hypothetical protein